MEDAAPDPAVLLKLSKTRMPFGKYKGRMLKILYEVKSNGLEYLLKPLR